jgi:hypothetical protein
MEKAILINASRSNGQAKYVNLSSEPEQSTKDCLAFLKANRLAYVTTMKNGDVILKAEPNNGMYIVTNDNGDVKSTIEEAQEALKDQLIELTMQAFYNFSF